MLVQHPVTQQAWLAAPSHLSSVANGFEPLFTQLSFFCLSTQTFVRVSKYSFKASMCRLARAAACSHEWEDTGRTEAFGLVGASFPRRAAGLGRPGGGMPPPACNQQRPEQPGEGTSITPAGNRPHLASGHDLSLAAPFKLCARTEMRRKQERSRLTV